MFYCFENKFTKHLFNAIFFCGVIPALMMLIWSVTFHLDPRTNPSDVRGTSYETGISQPIESETRPKSNTERIPYSTFQAQRDSCPVWHGHSDG